MVDAVAAAWHAHPTPRPLVALVVLFASHVLAQSLQLVPRVR